MHTQTETLSSGTGLLMLLAHAWHRSISLGALEHPGEHVRKAVGASARHENSASAQCRKLTWLADFSLNWIMRRSHLLGHST